MELQKLAKDSLLNSLKVNEEAPIENRDVEVPCPHVIINTASLFDILPNKTIFKAVWMDKI